jgi:hypothetical protein
LIGRAFGGLLSWDRLEVRTTPLADASSLTSLLSSSSAWVRESNENLLMSPGASANEGAKTV